MKTILIIEDEPLIRESIQDVLELEGYQILTACDGVLGVQLALEHLPDLILCDVNMPEKNGYEVLDSLQQEAKTSTIPFIFLTARTTKQDLRHGMTLGADDYLAKPCTAEELLRTISRRFEKQMARQVQSEQQLKSLRDSVVQSLPHEVYTPLNGILGFSEILSQEYATIDPLEVQEIGEAIHTSALRLHHLMQNFLLYTKLELMVQHPEPIPNPQSYLLSEINDVIQGAAQRVAEQVNRTQDLQFDLCVQVKNCQVKNCPHLTLHLTVAYLQKIVQELVDNAFKFSEPDTPVQITSQLQDNRLIFSVTNQGRGMTKEQIAQVGAYVQFDRKYYEQQGFGLGLIIVKRIAEVYGGCFSIHSVPGTSTTVQLCFGGVANGWET